MDKDNNKRRSRFINACKMFEGSNLISLVCSYFYQVKSISIITNTKLPNLENNYIPTFLETYGASFFVKILRLEISTLTDRPLLRRSMQNIQGLVSSCGNKIHIKIWLSSSGINFKPTIHMANMCICPAHAKEYGHHLLDSRHLEPHHF